MPTPFVFFPPFPVITIKQKQQTLVLMSLGMLRGSSEHRIAGGERLIHSPQRLIAGGQCHPGIVKFRSKL